MAVDPDFKKDRVGTNGHHSAKPSRVTYMAHAKGYVMVRHPGCMPFAISEEMWRSFPLWERPTKDPARPSVASSPVTDEEIDNTIAQIKEMAARIGCEFIPDAHKLAQFRRSQKAAQEWREKYRRAARDCWAGTGRAGNGSDM